MFFQPASVVTSITAKEVVVSGITVKSLSLYPQILPQLISFRNSHAVVSVYDYQCRIMKMINVNGEYIGIHHFAQGVYILKISMSKVWKEAKQ